MQSSQLLCQDRNFDDLIDHPCFIGRNDEPRDGFYTKRDDVFKVAMKRNTIAHIDTGAEKTMISVMIMNEIAKNLKKQKPPPNKLIVFLAPTRNLVEQQFNVLKESTDLVVDYYHGSKVGNIDGQKVDEWDAAAWEHETSKNQVMVMTPQILLDALRNGFVNFEMICLLIIDECHRASGNHPYVSIMKEYYHKPIKKPKVFGMTASPLTKKGVSSAQDCEAQIRILESILDSQVYTIQDRLELEKVTPSDTLKYCYYQPVKFDHEEMKLKLESSRSKLEVELLDMQMSVNRNFKDTKEKVEILRKRLSNDHAEIIYCIDELGLLCAYEAAKICLANAPKAVEECDIYKESCLKCSYFLEQALSIIGNSLPNGHEIIFDAGCDYKNLVAGGYISSKLYHLFLRFKTFREATKVSCLIFVERIITAQVVDIIVKKIADLSHLEVSYMTARPDFKISMVEDEFQCDMTLPPNAEFQTISGPLSKSSHLSKQLVCLVACKKLHQTGALSDHLLPHNEDPSEVKSSKIKEAPYGAGTTKRKELHGTTPIRAISGTWGEKLDDGVQYYAYKMSFKCSIAEVKYSSFVFLLESKLDDDVANFELDLYLVSKSVKCKVSSCAEVHLDAKQVAKAKCFQELFFNAIFGKLYIGSKQSKEPRQFLPEAGQKLWNPAYMFLLLPLEPLEPFQIYWKEIDSCASAFEFIKKNPLLTGDKQSTDTVMTDSDSTNIVHFANRSLHEDEVKEVVVLAIHTGKQYSVCELLKDETADSPFDGDAKRYSSFTDYFKKKYEIDLKYPGKNLVKLKQSHRAHNLLVDFNGEDGILHGKKIKADSSKVNTDRERYYARIPPELLVVIDARIDVVKSIYLLPSLMHRMESLMLASQLRAEINGHSTDFHISSLMVLEAITTLRCNESFSMERLELLGDSVLKYVVSCCLYLEYSKKQEGQLSSRRSWQVCNSTLYDLGIKCGIQGYIRDCAFDPTRWTAPGQLPLRPTPCDHDIDTLQVPIDNRYQSEDPTIMIGKFCDLGHRWLGSKTISDCVEALVGAYYVDGGLTGAIHCMNWLGISCELNPSRITEAIKIASLYTYTPRKDVLQTIEEKLGYEFGEKGLLVEAITHASCQDQGVGYCYQRLEFLGDSVLDLLITWYLYKKHGNIDPGELTDLRSASVNNENFAYAAVRRGLHHHLQYRSGYLESQIDEYVKFVATSSTDTNSLATKKSPKALGDLVESIAGAMLVDTKLNLDEVWRVFEPLLSPIVTPNKLELPPLRELMELCDSLGYFIKDECRNNGDLFEAVLRLQLKDVLLVGKSTGATRKIARGQAAVRLLKDLEKRGITRKNQGQDGDAKTTLSNPEPAAETSISKECLMEEESEVEVPVLKSIPMKKGGPRSSLYELCKKMQWPMPTFTPSERKSKKLLEFGEGEDKRTAFNSFEAQISLTIPGYGDIELKGDKRADKKSSYDSAALLMLYELQRLGKLKIGEEEVK
ncbi:endoribonuclease Dicer homolog 3a isoform X1 [Tanacetum coccineum]